ncbi:MAG TPA: dephospho-CoA kinase [Candidatus Kapabacteria bacterium]|nr:dephospho-CoA kinase [Candidatus Kapabacteria bacterium]HPO61705.1 dephospho-CoA kinase [Candidatus Kapabacteria bacterium]
MKTIGITGNIGSGKSSVSKIISELGYDVISSDIVAKKLMDESPTIRKKLIEKFGNETYLHNNTINVNVISKLVFGETPESNENLNELNRIVHPEVIDYIYYKIQEFEQEGKQMCFVESALIYEANIQEAFDYIIVVHSNVEISYSRIESRNNLSRDKFNSIEKGQISREEKKKLADFCVINNSDYEHLKEATLFVLDVIKSIEQK